MSEAVRAVLSGIQTVEDMIVAFSDKQQCWRQFEGMIWGRFCLACVIIEIWNAVLAA
jgi:hypothetical protein